MTAPIPFAKCGNGTAESPAAPHGREWLDNSGPQNSPTSRISSTSTDTKWIKHDTLDRPLYGAHLRLLDSDTDVDRLFLMHVQRRVRKDATISLGGRLWEVPAHLRGQIVATHFDPVNWTRVDLWFRDQFIARARLCNKQLNSQIRSSNDYQRFDF